MLIGGVYTDDYRDRDTGGPECDGYMSWEFRVIITAILVRCS
jgi:hypothetical protein